MAQVDLELDTTIRQVFGTGRRGALRDRLAPWALSVLWLLVVAVLVALW